MTQLPYSSLADLPEGVRNSLPKHAQEIWRSAFNSALKQYGSEDRARKVAWAAVKNKYHRKEEGKWEKKSVDEPFLVWSDQFLEIKSDGSKHWVEGYISCEGPDLVNDYVTRECLEDMQQQIKDMPVSIKLGIEHEHVLDDPRNLPLAKITDSQLDAKGLKAKIIVNEAHPGFSTAWNSIENKFLDSFSIEFLPLPDGYIYEMKNGTRQRKLNKVLLRGVTFTGRPVCPACSITDTFIKSLAIREENNKGDYMVETKEEVKTISAEELPKKEEVKSEELPEEEPKPEESKIDVKAMVEEIKAEIKKAIMEELKGLKPENKVLHDPKEEPMEQKPLSTRVEHIVARQMGVRGV